ncbi:hypothetical protein AAFC00_007164 [Neodothiora populina]|uniref:Mediator of RNA polymerase II transcription subunit 7 n=1 Tax=Neodothiora populina TaxID=2781224 RepID=A0ABR3PHN0_9PEZI
MADQTQARLPTAPFPAPPPFYNHFTEQNVAKLRELRKEAAKNKDEDGMEDVQSSGIDALSLPPDLRFLVPPEPPADGRYRSFGADYDLAQPSQSLDAAGIQQLYPAEAAESEQFDPTVHLVTLTRAVMCKFLEMVGVLSVNPTQAPECTEDLQTIFFNIHDLINRYRPHQARESLILMMEEQLEKIKSETARVQEVKEQKLAKMLDDMKKLQETSSDNQDIKITASDGDAEDAAPLPTDKRREAQQKMWEALDAELGD